ncbi:hypothetical protein ACJRO7_014901, partial [Eucalyptus globulus]
MASGHRSELRGETDEAAVAEALQWRCCAGDSHGSGALDGYRAVQAPVWRDDGVRRAEGETQVDDSKHRWRRR